MAESGRIAARTLRGTFRRIVAGADFSQSLYHRHHCLPRRHTREPRQLRQRFRIPSPPLRLVSMQPKMQRLTSSTIDLSAKLVRQWTNLPD
jgi:hypothetical protein